MNECVNVSQSDALRILYAIKYHYFPGMYQFMNTRCLDDHKVVAFPILYAWMSPWSSGPAYQWQYGWCSGKEEWCLASTKLVSRNADHGQPSSRISSLALSAIRSICRGNLRCRYSVVHCCESRMTADLNSDMFFQCAVALWSLGVSREPSKAPPPGTPPPTTPSAPRTMSGTPEPMPGIGWLTTTSSVESVSWESTSATLTRSVVQTSVVRSRNLIFSAKKQAGHTLDVSWCLIRETL